MSKDRGKRRRYCDAGGRAVSGNETFSYGQLERALVALHGGNIATLPTLRARAKHFQRIGAVPTGPGRGKRISYSVEDVIYWALIFELAETGFPPNTASQMMKRHGWSLTSFFSGPVGQPDRFLCIRADLLSLHLSRVLTHYNIGVMTAEQLRRKVLSNPDYARVVLINLSTLKRRLGEALGIQWKTYKREWDPSRMFAQPQEGDRAG